MGRDTCELACRARQLSGVDACQRCPSGRRARRPPLDYEDPPQNPGGPGALAVLFSFLLRESHDELLEGLGAVAVAELAAVKGNEGLGGAVDGGNGAAGPRGVGEA